MFREQELNFYQVSALRADFGVRLLAVVIVEAAAAVVIVEAASSRLHGA